MFNKKVLKMVGMLFFLMALFYFISNNHKKFPKDVPEEFKAGKYEVLLSVKGPNDKEPKTESVKIEVFSE